MSVPRDSDTDYLSEADREIGNAEIALTRARIALALAGNTRIGEQLRAISDMLDAVQIPGQG